MGMKLESCGLTRQAVHDIDKAMGGSYELPDGRKFWLDAATVRQIMSRITPVIGAECERHRLAAEVRLEAKFKELKNAELDGTIEAVMDRVSSNSGLVTYGDYAVAVRRFLVEHFEETP